MSGRSAGLGVAGALPAGLGWQLFQPWCARHPLVHSRAELLPNGGPFRGLAVVTIHLEEGCQLSRVGTAAPHPKVLSGPPAAHGAPLCRGQRCGEAQLKCMAGKLPGRRGPRLGPEEGALGGSGLGEVLQAE